MQGTRGVVEIEIWCTRAVCCIHQPNFGDMLGAMRDGARGEGRELYARDPAAEGTRWGAARNWGTG
jgi:hypothetical protein